MKVTRKLQHQLEIKIKHALATSQPLMVTRPSIARYRPKAAIDKVEGNGSSHSA